MDTTKKINKKAMIESELPADIFPHHSVLFSSQVPYGQFQHPFHKAHKISPADDHNLRGNIISNNELSIE